MGFIRRLLGSRETSSSGTGQPEGDADQQARPGDDPATAEERAYELDLLREEQERLDELRERQLRYAEHAWQPPAQGGERRADDADADPR